MHFMWRTNYLFSCISLSMGGIFLKPHTSHQTCMRCNRSNFLCDRSIIKNILLQEQSAFGVHLSFRRKDGHELHTSHSPRVSYRRNIGCDRSIIRSVKLENKNPLRLHLVFHWRRVHISKHLAFYTHAMQTVLSLVAIGQ
jgi:hypothetical protein